MAAQADVGRVRPMERTRSGRYRDRRFARRRRRECAASSLPRPSALVSVPRQPGSYTLSLKGKLDGDMSLDTRLVSASLDARCRGPSVRSPRMRDAPRSTSAVGKADVIARSRARTVPVAFKTRLVSDALGLRLDDLTAQCGGLGCARPAVGSLRRDSHDRRRASHRHDRHCGLACGGDRNCDARPKANGAGAIRRLRCLWAPKLAGRMSVSAAQAGLVAVAAGVEVPLHAALRGRRRDGRRH